jgi:hypothetical protein
VPPCKAVVGEKDGNKVGLADGSGLGTLGMGLGDPDGSTVGVAEGSGVGLGGWNTEGMAEGALLVLEVGIWDGEKVGVMLGVAEGWELGTMEGK